MKNEYRKLKFSPAQMMETKVFLPENIEKLRSKSDKASAATEITPPLFPPCFTAQF